MNIVFIEYLCMNQMATITSKRQLTIPVALFKKANLSQGDRVLIEERNGKLLIKKAVDLVEELAGSIKVPKKWKGKDIDQIIEESKRKYFSKVR